MRDTAQREPKSGPTKGETDTVLHKVMSAREAVGLIKDGDTIWVNAFLAIANPAELNIALSERVREGDGPYNLTVYCSAAFGDWSENAACEGYIRDGAVSRIVLGHYASMPSTGRMIAENKLEAYNLPLGVMSHMARAAAGGRRVLNSRIGRYLFVDPCYAEYRLNERSQAELVRHALVAGETMLQYDVPKVDVALIKGSSADSRGNISFEDECATVDALSIAQAAHRSGGKVIVQVSRITDRHQRPRNVIVPGMLVDAIVVCAHQSQIVNVSGSNMSLSGDVFAQGRDIEIWLDLLNRNMITNGKGRSALHRIIGNRAFCELRPGQIANIGIGIPELVGLATVRKDMLSEVCLTVESGATGGLPANGTAFGATIGADMIVDMAQQFDFYHGGGLDICFLGALEVDEQGDVNAHASKRRLTGIGGFADISQSSKTVVFCLTSSADGLDVREEDGRLVILSEGNVPKFVKKVESVSFSARNARDSGQRVLYVTERGVFRLAEGGLELCEAAPGVDVRRDILDRLPFAVSVCEDIEPMYVSAEE